MFDKRHLKQVRGITDTQVECPVKGCSHWVRRQRQSQSLKDPQFQCPDHKIYISPTTFEYQNETNNLLWKDRDDIARLQAIKTVKRESRIARENSEDALTWNVFRFLEQTNQLSALLSFLTDSAITKPELIYWSHSQRANGAYQELNRARAEFGETLQRGSEPDLIVVSDTAIFFIEAKLTSKNETTPDSSDLANRKKYLTGSNHWYREVFKSNYEVVAIEAKKYELLRLWLLGSWIAAQLDRDFYLINLVLAEREKNIERIFHPHIKTNPRRQFSRLSWEEIYRYIFRNAPPSPKKDLLIDYFRNKTIGYNKRGQLQLAFSIT